MVVTSLTCALLASVEANQTEIDLNRYLIFDVIGTGVKTEDVALAFKTYDPIYQFKVRDLPMHRLKSLQNRYKINQ